MFFLLVFSLFFVANSQNKAVNTEKLDSLLLLREQMIKKHEIKSFYTIQIFSGEREDAELAKKEYDSKNYKYKAIIEYETPNYKVWVGQYRTKLHADKTFAELKKDYPSALIFRPGR